MTTWDKEGSEPTSAHSRGQEWPVMGTLCVLTQGPRDQASG